MTKVILSLVIKAETRLKGQAAKLFVKPGAGKGTTHVSGAIVRNDVLTFSAMMNLRLKFSKITSENAINK